MGLWLWADVVNRRVGSLPVWRGEDDLHEFVRLRAHVQIMREYRQRGTLRSRTWEIDALDRAALWRALTSA